MPGKRRYDDNCGAAHALELVGERWALLVARELMLGPRRFSDLRAGLPGISPNVLTQRLQEFEAASIAVRRKLPPPASAWVYELTDWGYELEPIIREIGRWAARSPAMPQGRPMSVNSLILSFRTMFDADAAGDLSARLALTVNGQSFRVEIGDGALRVEPGEAPEPEAALSGSAEAIAAVVYGGQPLAETTADGTLRVTGDRSLVERFASLFPLPETAPATGGRGSPDGRDATHL